jgi:hypothetical protein
MGTPEVIVHRSIRSEISIFAAVGTILLAPVVEMNAPSTMPNPGKTNATVQTAKAGNTAARKFKLARGWGKSTTSALRLKSGKIDAVGQTKAAANVGTRSAPRIKTKSKLLPNEGKVDTYKELVKSGKRGDNLTPHHMPSAEYMKNQGISKNDGVCMNMEQPSPGVGGRHRLTRSYGSGCDLTETPRKALARDILDVKKIYQDQGLYSEVRNSLIEVIKKNKEFLKIFLKRENNLWI